MKVFVILKVTLTYATCTTGKVTDGFQGLKQNRNNTLMLCLLLIIGIDRASCALVLDLETRSRSPKMSRNNTIVYNRQMKKKRVQ